MQKTQSVALHKGEIQHNAYAEAPAKEQRAAEKYNLRILIFFPSVGLPTNGSYG
jgi:hypothetical protein